MLALLLLFADPSPETVFEKRIKPIFDSPNPSSCVQCHLSGVDLKHYIRPSHRETFLSLRDQGLVDFDHPEKSRILALIAMGQDDAGAKLIQKQTRDAEYRAFAEWIKACAADPVLRSAPRLSADQRAKPPRPDEVIRHARKDRLLESFENSIWAMRFRCMSCHIEGRPENAKKVAEFGPRVAWMKAAGPEATLKYLMESNLIDAKNPANSLLLKKPLNTVKHDGGQKFLVGDQGYRAYRQFLEDYAAIVGDRYTKASELPAKSPVEAFGSEAWLKIENTPPAWADKLLMVKIYAWDSSKQSWEVEPIATTDRKVWGGGKLWQHTITLRAVKGSERAKAWKTNATLPPGKYLVKVYVDTAGKAAKDWTAELGETEYVGQAEVQAAWRPGYGKMTVLNADRVR